VQHAPLNTRDVLYGCRTEATVLHYAIRDGETIEYYDIMRLYLYVCKYSKFPVGHPKIHVGDASRDKQAILSKEGLIKYTVLLSKRLCHPVQQFRCNNKLLFCLCRTCTVECIFSSEWVHESTAQKSVKSTWVLGEVMLAIQKGYQVLHIMEMYRNKVTK
jgi:hypothetical protein